MTDTLLRLRINKVVSDLGYGYYLRSTDRPTADWKQIYHEIATPFWYLDGDNIVVTIVEGGDLEFGNVKVCVPLHSYEEEVAGCMVNPAIIKAIENRIRENAGGES